jgi:hypothetical protein
MTNEEIRTLRVELLTLSTPQRTALEALVAGETQTQAAKIAGVSREMVCRWSNHHPAFMATLAGFRLALAEEQMDALARVRGKALAVIERAVDEGDLAASMGVFRISTVSISDRPMLPEDILERAIVRLATTMPEPRPKRDAGGFLDPLSSVTAPSADELAPQLAVERIARAVAPEPDSGVTSVAAD